MISLLTQVTSRLVGLYQLYIFDKNAKLNLATAQRNLSSEARCLGCMLIISVMTVLTIVEVCHFIYAVRMY